MGLTKTVVVSDIHIPFHDKKHVALFLAFVETVKPDRVILNGDIGDIYNPSAYKSNPIVTAYASIEDEIDALRRFIDDVRYNMPLKSELVYLLGNHEARFNKYVMENAPVMQNLLTLENELDLANSVDLWMPYRKIYQLEQSNLSITHSPPSYAVNAARASYSKRVGKSFMYGCTHRPDWFFQKRFTGGLGEYEIDTVYVTGTLGDKYSSHINEAVFDYEKSDRSAPSFAVVNCLDGKEFWVENQLIKNDKICIDGRMITTEDEWK